MVVDKLYKLKRGNQTQKVGLIIKGATASVEVYGSQAKPTALADMELCHDAVSQPTLDNGTWTFSMLPEYVYFDGTADSIGIIGMGFDNLNISF